MGADVLGDLAVRGERRGDHEPDVVLDQDVRGPVADLRLEPGEGDRAEAPQRPVVGRGLAGVADPELDVVDPVERAGSRRPWRRRPGRSAPRPGSPPRAWRAGVPCRSSQCPPGDRSVPWPPVCGRPGAVVDRDGPQSDGRAATGTKVGWPARAVIRQALDDGRADDRTAADPERRDRARSGSTTAPPSSACSSGSSSRPRSRSPPVEALIALVYRDLAALVGAVGLTVFGVWTGGWCLPRVGRVPIERLVFRLALAIYLPIVVGGLLLRDAVAIATLLPVAIALPYVGRRVLVELGAARRWPSPRSSAGPPTCCPTTASIPWGLRDHPQRRRRSRPCSGSIALARRPVRRRGCARRPTSWPTSSSCRPSWPRRWTRARSAT